MMLKLAAMSRVRVRLLFTVVVSALALAALAGASASAGAPASAHVRPAPARVPNGFVGAVAVGPLFPTRHGVDLARQLDLMVASGVETVRVVFDWATAQPDPNAPIRFGAIDQLVGLAADRGLNVLPTVLNAPAWDGTHYPGAAVDLPESDYYYGQFLQALVQRYGPHGSFWAHRKRKNPIRMWQIWNEPNIPAFWPVQPFAPGYVTLLEVAHNAIKSLDPGAKIVLAGLPNFSWVNLAQIYQVSGARAQFDVVAAHPYTHQPQGVITILSRIRRVMNAAGDGRKPIVADEVSWPSSSGQTSHTLGLDIATTEAGQARRLNKLIPLLARNRVRLGLIGFAYYAWATVERHNGLPFDFSGLLKFSAGKFIEKLAFNVFRTDALALERCREKGSLATVCLKSY
jgi:hypothetical protein